MADLTVRAILRPDDSLELTVVGQESFGRKSATIDSKSAGISIDPNVEAAVKAALVEARDDANRDDAVSKRAQIAAFESAQIALRMGEDI